MSKAAVSGNLSRRQLLNGGTGIAAMAGLSLLTGTAGPSSVSADEALYASSGIAYEVYDADVLVIGAGVSAGQAALQAVSEGRAAGKVALTLPCPDSAAARSYWAQFGLSPAPDRGELLALSIDDTLHLL